jgi:predicted nucleic acid-binding protein
VKAFIDTSSLFKKYVHENGSDMFDTLLHSITEIIIAPITLLEINSIIERRIREKTLKISDAKWIEKEFFFDLNYYGVVKFNEKMIQQCIKVIRKYQLKVLDSIQLSSALISEPEIFIVSDKRLFSAAQKELKQVKFVG